MAGYGWTWLELAGTCLKWLEMLEMTGMAGNCCTRLEIAGKSLEWLESLIWLEMDGMARKCW